MSNVWLNAIKTMSDVEMVGLVDLNEAAAQSRAEQFGLAGARVGTDFKKMLGEVKPDIVFDLTIPEAHHNVVLTALGHGCHVLGEKPLAAGASFEVPKITYAGCACAVVIDIDTETSAITLRRVVAGADVGRAVNPALVDAQIVGGKKPA